MDRREQIVSDLMNEYHRISANEMADRIIKINNAWIKSHAWARRNETGEIFYMIPESELTNVD